MCWLLRFVEAPADKMRVSCQKFPLVYRWKRRAKKFSNAPTKAEQRKSGSRYTRRGNNAGFKTIKKSALLNVCQGSPTKCVLERRADW